jgi:phosphoribosylamine--glycine ligase
LFAGLMLTASGPKVLEFNVRFGDPECQALMCLWDDDPAPWLLGAATGALPAGAPRFADAFACCVVLAAPGYPDAPTLGAAIPEAPMPPGARRFVAGAERGSDGKLRVSGGRVLCVAGVGATAAEARARAYAAVPSSRFEGALVRSDIGASTV